MNRSMDTLLEELCHRVMKAVVGTGVVNEGNIEHATAVMRAEIKAFIFGDEYADDRTAIVENTVSEQEVFALVVASCVLKIQEGAAA